MNLVELLQIWWIVLALRRSSGFLRCFGGFEVLVLERLLVHLVHIQLWCSPCTTISKTCDPLRALMTDLFRVHPPKTTTEILPRRQSAAITAPSRSSPERFGRACLQLWACGRPGRLEKQHRPVGKEKST